MKLKLGVVVALVVLQAPVSAAQPVQVPSVSFRVRPANGVLDRAPFVLSSVVGDTYSAAIASTGSAAGVVTVPLPATDPVVVSRLRRGEPVNMIVRVFDRPPHEAGVQAAYVGVNFMADDAGNVVGSAGEDLQRKAVVLRPGITDFRPFATRAEGLAAVALAARENSTGEATEDENCPFVKGGGHPEPSGCTDYPQWSMHTEIPVATNFGGGVDFSAEIVYGTNKVTETSFAVSAGVGGFVAGDGRVKYQKLLENSIGFAPVGSGQNYAAYLDTVMQRRRDGSCYKDFSTVPPQDNWYCQYETTYLPFEAAGSVVRSTAGEHDRLDRATSCWAPVHGFFEDTRGVTGSLSWSLTLGPTEEWAYGDPGLYANTTITGQTATGKSVLRRWNVTGSSRNWHYLFVPFGLAIYNAHEEAGGEGACPSRSPNDSYTHATDVDLRNVREDFPDKGPVSMPSDPEPGRVVCGRMPDKCD